MRKDFKSYVIIGLLTANLVCLINPVVQTKADSGLQSTGKIVLNNPETGQQEIVFDYKDQEKLKSSINANTIEINDLNDFVEQKTEDLENEINEVNNSLGGLDVRYNPDSGLPEWSERGADTWFPFKSKSISANIVVDGVLNEDATYFKSIGTVTFTQEDSYVQLVGGANVNEIMWVLDFTGYNILRINLSATTSSYLNLKEANFNGDMIKEFEGKTIEVDYDISELNGTYYLQDHFSTKGRTEKIYTLQLLK